MVVDMKGSFFKIIYMVKDVLNGEMVVNIKENIIMMLNKDMVNIFGKRIQNMKECGMMENGMGKVN